MMRSKVQALAKQQGIKNPQELAWAARITWPTAAKVWDENADLSKTWAVTMQNLASGLKCHVEDLYVLEPN